MKLDELRARLRVTERPAELDKPPLGRVPYCAGCMKRLDKCEGRETCKGFLSDDQAEMLDVGAEVIERLHTSQARCAQCGMLILYIEDEDVAPLPDDDQLCQLCRGDM